MKPSDVIGHFEKDVQIGDKFILVCRASGKQAQQKLDQQEKDLRRAVDRKGGIVVRVFRHTGDDPPSKWLQEVAQLAKEHSAIILAENTKIFCPSF